MKKKTGNVCNSSSPGGRFQTDQVGYNTQNSQGLGKGTQESSEKNENGRQMFIFFN